MTVGNGLLGTFLKQHVLEPSLLSVSEAARLIGVSRVTLSKLLNGQGTLSAKVAARIERVFGISAEQLLKLRAQAVAERTEKANDDLKVFAYPFPEIKARDLEQWADTIEARTELPVLIRRLIATTGEGVSRCDFPGYDNGQRPGWDGVAETVFETSWIPKGLSLWELSTSKAIALKATKDFQKRCGLLPDEGAAATTYVYVTLRTWSPKEKAQWLRKAKAQQRWNDVRVYDAEDLERWLERSLEARLWVAERLNRPDVTGVRTLDCAWDAWIYASVSPVGLEFFAEAVEENQSALKTFLNDAEALHLVVSAASVDEGLAYLWAALQTAPLSGYRDRILVFDSADALRKMGLGQPNFIAVVHDLETDSVCQALRRPLKSVFIQVAADDDEADVTIRPLSGRAMFQLSDRFKDGQSLSCCTKPLLLELLQDCGGSLTVLHRRWSRFPEQRCPVWGRDTEKASELLAAAMMGQWTASNDWQMSVLLQLAGDQSLKGFDRCFKQWLKHSDAPVWRYDDVCGVVAKSDIFFSLRDALTPKLLDRFYDTLLGVLRHPGTQFGDFDEIGLPTAVSDRWVSQTRHQLADTAAFFAAQGSVLVKGRCACDFEQKGDELVRKLLQPLTAAKLKLVGFELSRLAEIASGTLLQILEEDWVSPQSVIRDLLSVVTSQNDVLSYLLEAMAFSAQLSEDDFMKTCRLLVVWWAECPVNRVRNDIERLLEKFFTPGVIGAVTSAHLGQALRWVVKTSPEIGRWLCYRRLASKTVIFEEGLLLPHWKQGGGQEWTDEEKTVYQNTAGALLLSITGTAAKELTELLTVTHAMSETVLTSFYKRLVRWFRRKTSEESRAEMREIMRSHVNFQKLPDVVREDFESFYQQLEPNDVVQKYRWLFESTCVSYSAGETEDEHFNWEKRENEVGHWRKDALKAILNARGVTGILELARYGKAQYEIGKNVVGMLTEREWSELAVLCVSESGDLQWKTLVQGLTTDVTSERLQRLGDWEPVLPQSLGLRLLCWLPFRKEVWQWMERVPKWSEAYWKTVSPVCVTETEDGLTAVKSLLLVNRPWAAFTVIQRQPELVGAEVLLKILLAMLQSAKEETPWRAESLSSALKIVVRAPDIPLRAKACVVFYFVDVLECGCSENIRVLSSYIAVHPEFYVNLVGWTYERDDGQADAAVYREKARYFCSISRTTLQEVRLMETLRTEFSYERLKKWVNSVRQGCREIGRLATGDVLLGKLMVRSLYDAKAVRFPMNFYRLLADVGSEELEQGVVTELLNTREPRWCSVEEYGNLDRWMVGKIREEMDRVRYQWPQGMEVLRALERQYLTEAKVHDTKGKVSRRGNVLPW